MILIDLTRNVYGKLTVIKRVPRAIKTDKNNAVYWLCKCECGNIKIIEGSRLRDGEATDCGCVSKSKYIRNLRYGTKLYDVYRAMLKRCYNSNVKNYKNYGGRGITVCYNWRNNFMSFYDWAINNGYKNGLTLDRMNNDGNYEPSNCRWVGYDIQENNTSRNKLLTYNGKTMSISQWCKILNVNASTLFARCRYGWSTEDILTKPVKRRKNENEK